MGEPRLSDIAPDLVSKHQDVSARRSGSLKSNRSEPQQQRHEVAYCAVPTSEEVGSDEEVLVADGAARYYNLGEQRRHSIGTFMRDRTMSVGSSTRSFREESVKMSGQQMSVLDDHSLRHGSYPRKRCNRCTKGESTNSLFKGNA